MKSQLDGEIPEYSLSPRGGGKRQQPSSSKAPWVIALLAMCAAGGAGYFANAMHEKNVAVTGDVASLRTRATEA